VTTPHSKLGPLDPRRAIGRATIAIVVAVASSAALSSRFSATLAVLGGWDVGGTALLALAWMVITRCDHDETRERAGSEDPGRTAVYLLVTLASLVSLVAAVILPREARSLVDPLERQLLVALCLFTVGLSWAITHTSYTLRYAHLVYREDDEGVGGAEFPGRAPPTYFDFAYFAFTVGMCFQVSDVSVTSPQLRRAVLAHAVLSFGYNTVILAFALNLVFGSFN